MTNYQNGANRERRVLHSLKEQGFDLVFRSAGSHSPIDLFALDIKTKQIWLIQCKPKSMSIKAKQKLELEINKFEGNFSVKTKVISLSTELNNVENNSSENNTEKYIN